MTDARLICFAAVLTLVWRTDRAAAQVGLLDYSAKCVSENGVTHDVAESIQQGTLPKNQKEKCYVSCVLKSIRVVDSKGKISTDVAQRIVDMYSTESDEAKTKTKKDIVQCAQQANRARNECETAFRMMKCTLMKRGGRPPQTRNITIGLPQTVTIQLPPLSFTLFSVG